MPVTRTQENFSALKFNESIASTIEEICEPLFTSFGITNFGYVRIFEDGRMLRLSTDKEWTKKYFERGFYNDFDFYELQKVPEGGVLMTIVNNMPVGDHFSALYDANIWNIFIIYERFKDFGNVWFFATSKENHQLNNFYINNLDILSRFIFYFKEKTLPIIKNSNNNSLITTKVKPLIKPFQHQAQIDSFLQQIDIKQYHLQDNLQLSKREFECLRYISRGKTTKEIAREINLSPRTIEWHVENIKKKTTYNTKSQLLNIVFEGLSGLLKMY